MLQNKNIIVAIGQATWRVSIEDSHSSKLCVDGDVSRGCTWCGKHEICLSNELTRLTFRRVCAHELTHAILFSTQACLLETYTEEQLCDFMALYGGEVVNLADKLEEWAFRE